MYRSRLLRHAARRGSQQELATLAHRPRSGHAATSRRSSRCSNGTGCSSARATVSGSPAERATESCPPPGSVRRTGGPPWSTTSTSRRSRSRRCRAARAGRHRPTSARRMAAVRRAAAEAGLEAAGPVMARFYDDVSRTARSTTRSVCPCSPSPDGSVPDAVGEARGELVPAHHALTTVHEGRRDAMDDAVARSVGGAGGPRLPGQRPPDGGLRARAARTSATRRTT